MKKSIIISFLLIAAVFTLNAQVQSPKVTVHEISVSELLKMNGVKDLLKMYEPTVDYSQHTYRSFEFSMNVGNLEITELVVGSDWNAKVLQLITGAKSGTKMYFEKIGASDPVNRKFSILPSVILQIK